jgi:hypothetical protein
MLMYAGAAPVALYRSLAKITSGLFGCTRMTWTSAFCGRPALSASHLSPPAVQRNNPPRNGIPSREGAPPCTSEDSGSAVLQGVAPFMAMMLLRGDREKSCRPFPAGDRSSLPAIDPYGEIVTIDIEGDLDILRAVTRPCGIIKPQHLAAGQNGAPHGFLVAGTLATLTRNVVRLGRDRLALKRGQSSA